MVAVLYANPTQHQVVGFLVSFAVLLKYGMDTHAVMADYLFIEKGETVKVAPSPLMPRKERTGGAAKRANSLRLQRGE